MLFYFVLFAVVVSAGGMLFAVLTLLQKGNEGVEDRLTSLTQNSGRGSSRKPTESTTSLLKGALIEDGDSWDAKLNRLFPISKMLEQSGTGFSLQKLLGLTAGFAVTTAAISLYLLPGRFALLACLAGLMAAPLPLMYVRWKRNKRMDQFGRQLPAAMDLMGQALRAGQSLPSAIQLVGEQVGDPLGPAFHHAFEQQNLGVSITDTLRDMTARVPNLDLQFFATAVILQRQTGGDLGRDPRENFSPDSGTLPNQGTNPSTYR